MKLMDTSYKKGYKLFVFLVLILSHGFLFCFVLGS